MSGSSLVCMGGIVSVFMDAWMNDDEAMMFMLVRYMCKYPTIF